MKKFKTFLPALGFLFLAGCGILEPIPDELLEVVNQTEPGLLVLSKTGAENNWQEAGYLESNVHELYSRNYYRDDVSISLVVSVIEETTGEPVASFNQTFNLNGWWTNQNGAFVVSIIERNGSLQLQRPRNSW